MNILFVVEEEKEEENIFEMINYLKQLENYSIHKLNLSSFLKDPWQKETSLVIFKNFLSYEKFLKIKEKTKSNFMFFLNPQKKKEEKKFCIISKNSKEEFEIKSNENCSIYDEIKNFNCLYHDKDDENKFKIVKSDEGIFFSFFPKFESFDAKNLFSKILEQFNMNSKMKNTNLSNLYLFNKKHTLIEMLKNVKILDKNKKFKFMENELIFHTNLLKKDEEENKNTKNLQNIFSIDFENQKEINFSIETYLKHLKVKKFSNIVLFGERVSSTQNFLNT